MGPWTGLQKINRGFWGISSLLSYVAGYDSPHHVTSALKRLSGRLMPWTGGVGPRPSFPTSMIMACLPWPPITCRPDQGALRWGKDEPGDSFRLDAYARCRSYSYRRMRLLWHSDARYLEGAARAAEWASQHGELSYQEAKTQYAGSNCRHVSDRKRRYCQRLLNMEMAAKKSQEQTW